MQIRNKLLITISLIFGLTIAITPVFSQFGPGYGDLPEEYYPNFHIQEEWEQLLDYFIDVEASRKVGIDLEEKVFGEMNSIFDTIFDYFPQSSANEVIYRQCSLITRDLSNEITRSKYTTFKERCYEPLGEIIKDINTKYMVKANIIANPKKGSSPLNVTFDGRGSEDPSNDTIPSNNFYRWYKDVYGVEQAIGRGPVVNYTFRDPGNHVVHLTVRSSNNYEEGIFDGEESININVAPKAANMIVYINGQRIVENRLLKVGSQDAERGLLIDGTATVPIGARTIVEHKWTIRGSSEIKYNFEQSDKGSPGQFIHKFPQNGVYTIILEIIDNEGNRLKETYKASISDPVATIKFKPEKGTTSSQFTFDAAASYSITSRIKTYQWTITDPNGRQIDQIESKELKRSFSIPGTYSVKLTVTDALGSSSYDIEQLYVSSTPPVPTFIITPESDRKYPSQFILDATGTFDEDVRAGTDNLTYNWSFSNSKNVSIERKIETDGSKIRVSMKEPGTFKVKLMVEDSFGEIVEVEKDINVVSTLRPELIVSPQVGVRGEPVTFVAKVNKPVSFYERDFGDGKKQQSKEPKVTHEYAKAGNYEVKLQVITESSEKNELTRGVFMGQKDMPVPAYTIKGPLSTALQKSTTCDDGNDTHEAFLVERYQNIIIDASKSTNAQGKNTDLTIAFHPMNDQVYSKNVLSYNFPETGCAYVNLFVEDSNIGKTESTKIWFKVINALPILQNLTLTFPQAGGSSPLGVGGDPTTMNTSTDIFSNASIIVKVQAKGSRDPDGFISHYRWYYYPSGDPLRKEGFKITPGDVPYTTFIIPKPLYATEYTFAVEMIDNDNGKVSSEDIVGKGPIVFFPPEEDSLDVPLVTLTVDKLTTRVGEEVTFTTKSSTISERPDFESSRYFKYDFDGDGIYDIPSTKKSKVTHTYTQAGKKKPKVSVYYKGRAGVGTTETLTVLKGLKPHFEIATNGTTALVKDFSIGDIDQISFCMDTKTCSEKESEGRNVNESIFVYTYPKAGDYLARLDVIDEFSNEQTARQHVKIEESNDDVGLLSIPQAIKNNDGTYQITVGNATEYGVNFYLQSEYNCFVDLDISVDTNADGDPTLDEDISCNELQTVTLHPLNKKQYGRLYYGKDNVIIETDILFDFFEFEPEINDEYNWARENIDDIIKSINNKDGENSARGYYKDLLINLKETLGERNEMNSILLQIRDHINENPLMLDEKEKIAIDNLINALSDETIQEVFGGTPYQNAKAEILTWIQEDDKKALQALFAEFDQAQGNKEELKAILDKIFTYIGDIRDRGDLDEVDFNHIKGQLCDIVIYFELPSVSCGTTIDKPNGDDGNNKSSKNSVIKTVLKVFLRIIIGGVIIVGIIIVIFAINAKRKKQDEEKE